jgi:hypothetical protein
MTNRIDAVSHWMQATHGEAVIDSVFSNPTLHQLPSRNHPVLPSRQLRDERIGAPAKPPQPVYFAG